MRVSIRKISVYSLVFLLGYIAIPFYLSRRLSGYQFQALSLFYLSSIAVIYFTFRRFLNYKNCLLLKTAGLEEKINILNNEKAQEHKNSISLQEKIRRYSKLKNIIEELNKNLSLESSANHLITNCLELIANNKGNCILYLLDSNTQKFGLYKAKKEDKKLIIKHKEGDLFDQWVLRHMVPLYINDIKKDFRFDMESLKAHDARPIASLISSPLITEHAFIGILRLDSNQAGFYTQDDLRLLVAISELGAVAIENDLFFQKTKDLAVHDGLTQVYTKGYFLERLKDECRRNFRQGAIFSLLLLDIDYFKNYNDKFGHAAGDIVLQTITSAAGDFLGDLNPVIGRFGGEEFCIILSSVDKVRAETIANGLLKKIENTKIVLRRQETNVTVSIGVAVFPEDATGEDELILKADRAMYEAKQKGRNNVVVA